MTTPSGPGGEFRYWAFISYSSKDAAVAKKLHRALETYSVPRDLRGRPGRDGMVPAKLFPIFRDRDELPLAADLGSTITDVLKASAYLIVLCSPNSAKSKWVDAEVRNFKAMGKADRIIAFILDGEPNAADIPGKEHLECFPPSLKVRVNPDGTLTDEAAEPIGGDLRKGGDGWNVAFLKSVAGITGLGFDAFARREKKRQRVKKFITACVALGVAAGGFGWWDYTRVKVKHYHQVVLKRGVPVGLLELTDDELEKCGSNYLFESSRRKVRRVRAVNSKGTPVTLSAPEMAYPPATSQFAIEYREDGSVAAHVLKNVSGIDILRHVYSEDQTVLEFRNPRQNTVISLGGNDTSLGLRSTLVGPAAESGTRQSEIARWRLRYDANGWPIERRNENAWGAPTADADGSYGVRYVRNATGGELEETSVDADGNPTAGLTGRVATRRNEFAANGRVTCVRLFDAAGNPAEGPDYYAITRITHDAVGNSVEFRYFDARDRPVANRDGYAIFQNEPNAEGQVIRTRVFDAEGKPTISLIAGVHETRAQYDAHGRMTRNDLFDTSGKPAKNNSGVHSYRDEYDSRGRQIQNRTYGLQDEPVPNGKTMVHRKNWVYDDQDNLIEELAWGIADEAVANEDLVHRAVYAYDSQGRSQSARTYGTDNQPCLNRLGYHETRFRYDQRNNITQTLYFGSDGKPVLTSEGYHIIRRAYDERGLLTEEYYLGLREEPILRKDWPIHRLVKRYNESGHLVERRFFGTSGQAMYEPEEGYHIERFERDRQGNPMREEYFNAEEKPVNRRSDSVHRVEREYDKRGNIVAEQYFNIAGQKSLNSQGVHRLVRKWDERGKMTQEEVYGIGGQAVSRLSTGVHLTHRQYTARGLLEFVAYYDTAGKPTTMREKVYHQIRYEYDEHGQQSKAAYFAPAVATGVTQSPSLTATPPNGNGAQKFELTPVALPTSGAAEERTVYDIRGKLLSIEWRGTSGEPVISKTEGCHRREITLDTIGQPIETHIFGTDNQPINNSYGYQCSRLKRDARGNLIERSYFDKTGKPILHKSMGAHLLKSTFDERGNVIEESNFDIAGKPMIAPPGLHKVVQKFDAYGHETEERYFGIHGEPVALPDSGVHATYTSYDGFGNETALWMVGLDNQPVAAKSGYYLKEQKYDERGNLISTAFFGKNREPMTQTGQVYHCERWVFNELNQPVEQIFEDVAGKPVVLPNSYASTKSSYDARGNRCEILYFGADGKPMLYHGGSRWVRTYDPATNQPLETIAYDLDGKRVSS